MKTKIEPSEVEWARKSVFVWKILLLRRDDDVTDIGTVTDGLYGQKYLVKVNRS